MAKVYPSGWRELNAIPDVTRELETLEFLGQQLSDSYSIYHGVHWTRIQEHNYSVFGEIDFVVVSPTGRLLFIEQKTGFLEETADGLKKRYYDKTKDIAFQMSRNSENLQLRLKSYYKDEKIFSDSILYCPDYLVVNKGSAGIPDERIVDKSRKDRLVKIIKDILPDGEFDVIKNSKLHNFLTDVLEIVPDVNIIIGEANTLYTKLSGGLAHWAQSLEFTPFRLRVIGTAGSGKTQLAVNVYRKSILLGRRPLYVCYNRPLADHIAKIIPEGGDVATYHQFADRLAKKNGVLIDYTLDKPFAQMENFMNSFVPSSTELYDDLIIDEGQDMNQVWANNLMKMVKPEGNAWWLEDPMQNLYGREPVELPNWVTIRSQSNYRTPRNILHELNSILGLKKPIESISPIAGHSVDVIFYSETESLVEKTIQAIDMAITMGYKPQHIALLTYRGRENSALAPYTQLGKYTLHAPQSKYDSEGNLIYSEGEIEIDSVHRFKGRAAPCVILTEIDFNTLDENAQKRIFVGATRATMRLIMVMSRNSKDVMLKHHS